MKNILQNYCAVDIIGGGGGEATAVVTVEDDENDMLAVQSRIAMAERIAKGDDPGVVRTSFFEKAASNNDHNLSLWSRIFGKKNHGNKALHPPTSNRPKDDEVTTTHKAAVFNNGLLWLFAAH